MKGANCPWVEIGPSGKNNNSRQIGFFNGQGGNFGRPDLKDPGELGSEILWSGRPIRFVFVLQVSAPYLETQIL